jgi:type I restriction enzyme S subunit
MNAETFFQNFGHLGDAPNGVQKLRELVLELAIRGRLVEQNAADEPAMKLIAHIENYRNKLIQDKKFSRFHPLPEIRPEDVSCNLPSGWVWSRLYNLGLINPRNEAEDECEVSFIPMTFIPDGFNGEIKFTQKKWGEVRSGFTQFADNDVVMAKITPCFQNRKSAVMRKLINGVGAGTTELHVFRPFGNTLCPEYVLIFLKSSRFIETGVSKMTGSAGQKRVPKEYFATTPYNGPRKLDHQLSYSGGLETQRGN